MKFQGKVDWWFWLLFVVVNLMGIREIIGSFKEADNLVTDILIYVAVFGLIDVLILPILIKNDVLLEGDDMFVRFGLFRTQFRISGLVEMKPSHSPISSMAASLDRIYIRSTNNQAYIAVKDKKAFFEEVYKRNPKLRNK